MAGPTHAQLNAKIDELQTALDLEQQQVADAFAARDAAIAERDAVIVEKDALIAQRDAAIVTLNETIAALEAQLADGGTPEERQATLDKLNAALTDLQSTIAP